MKYNYITIEREYGSGGTEIARLLADKCRIPCYGREILEAVAAKYEITVDRIEKYEETVTNSFLYSVFVMSQARSGATDMLAADGHIFVAEQAEIKRLAADGSTIFLGHCASEALRGERGLVRVYIRSGAEQKRARITKLYDIQQKDADAVMKHFDKKRANYYYANTAKKWDDMRNFDVVLDSGVLGIERCVEVLSGLLK